MTGMYSLKTENLQAENNFPKLQKEALEKFSCQGVQEFSFNEAQVDEILGEAAYCGGELPEEVLARIEAATEQPGCEFFFSQKENAEAFQRELIETYNLKSELVEYPDQDWNEEWKKFYKPIIVDDFVIVPAWEENYEKRTHTVFIHPGMAFGTGDHPTTYLCLYLMQLWLKGEFGNGHKTFLDMGCGSGILGIAAAKAGFETGEFCDIDSVALNNCHENLKINRIPQEQVSYFGEPSDLNLEISHDFIFANILAPILIENADLLIRKTKVGGGLVLAGLLVEQEEQVLKAFTKKFEIIHIERKDDWSGILLRRI